MTTALAETLVIARTRKQLDQQDVARKLGVTQQMVSKWERAVSRPAAKHLPKLAKLLGIDIEELTRLRATGDATAAETLAMAERLDEIEARHDQFQTTVLAAIAGLRDQIELLLAGGDDRPVGDDPRV